MRLPNVALAVLLSIGVLAGPPAARADVCDDAFAKWVESYETGRPVTISGTVKEVFTDDLETFSFPGRRAYVIFFNNACYDFLAESLGSVPCHPGQNVVVRGVVVDIDIGIIIMAHEARC